MSDEDRLLKEKYNGVKTADYDAGCRRLRNGEPLAYVIGWVPFLDCRIYLDSHPLIPRPETEFWVEKAIQTILSTVSIYRYSGQVTQQIRGLDLFAGSGAIGIAVLKHIPDSRVDFGEINRFHLHVIEKNIRENNIESERAKVIQTDVWSALSGTYDVVLANPPYIAKERTGRIQESVLNHEPHDALFAADEGFELIEKTIRGARAHLTETGILFIEHEPEQAEKLSATATAFDFTAVNKKDQYGVLRYSMLSCVS